MNMQFRKQKIEVDINNKNNIIKYFKKDNRRLKNRWDMKN